MEGDGHKQVIHHFKVDAALSNQTLKVRLPVHSFSIRVTQNGQHVANTLFSIFIEDGRFRKEQMHQELLL